MSVASMKRAQWRLRYRTLVAFGVWSAFVQMLPFVAMHFATNELDKMDKDGVIWMVNFISASKSARWFIGCCVPPVGYSG